MYADELSNVLRMAVLPTARFRQFCDAKDFTDKGLHRGATASWNVYSEVATPGASMLETQTFAETNFTITQKSLTVTEYGNSVPFTQKLDNLSKHPVQEIIHKVLKIDCGRVLDAAAHAQFNATKLKAQPDSGTNVSKVAFFTNGDVTGTVSVALSKDHVRNVVDQMKTRNIPAYMGDDYFCISRPLTLSTLKDELEAIHQYTEEGFRRLMYGEVGKYYGMRFVEQTSIQAGGAEDSATYNSLTTADPWNSSATPTMGLADWAFFFGEDTVAECVVIPEEIRGKIPGDFGRSRGVAWYYMGGFGLVHGSTNDDANARIVKWDSQA
jgi:N4-gp56 family major capsid protein